VAAHRESASGRSPAAVPRWPRQLRALLLKDLRLELRTRETVVAMVLFAVVVMVIFQFGFGTRADEFIRSGDLTPLAGGLLWVTIALTSVLGVGRTYVAEREQRVLDGLLVAPVSRLLLMVAKAIAIVAYLAAVEVVAVPLLGAFFVDSLSLADVGWIAIVCLLADLGIAVLGTLLASLALFSRARELLLPVLFLPSLVPVVIAAAGATHAVAGGANDLAEYRGYCLFLGIYALTFALVAYATYEVVFDD
jgi:heme exporter protein B